MSYIFVDESGDLGFNFKKKGTSRYFLISFLFVPSTTTKRRIGKIVSNTFLTLKKSKKRKSGILHAYKESAKTRFRLLNKLTVEDIKIMTISLDKEKVYTDITSEKNILYSNIVNILLNKIYTLKLIPTDEKIYLIASKRETNKLLNDNFKKYIEGNKDNKFSIEVSILSPEKDKCLQAVDFVSWSIYRKYKNGDYDYYNVIKNNIVEESWMYGE